jgi:hypothetical protein
MKYLIVQLFVLSIFLNPVQGQPESSKVQGIIFANDSLFWDAYNTCDADAMSRFFTPDIEFYHDKGGPTIGLQKLIEVTKKGLCGNAAFRLRREAVRGTVKVFPMQNAGTIYGAIISGEHVFYIIENDKQPRLDGKAKFTHLWLFENNVWKMSRILSYDHGPATNLIKRKAITLPPKTLSRFVGNYTGSKFGAGEVKIDNGQLVLIVGGNRIDLLPESDSSFFVADRDLTFEFISDDKGSVKKIVIRENGSVVDEFDKSR